MDLVPLDTPGRLPLCRRRSRLKGRFDTTRKKVKYQIGFIPSDGQWRLSGVTVDIE